MLKNSWNFALCILGFLLSTGNIGAETPEYPPSEQFPYKVECDGPASIADQGWVFQGSIESRFEDGVWYFNNMDKPNSLGYVEEQGPENLPWTLADLSGGFIYEVRAKVVRSTGIGFGFGFQLVGGGHAAELGIAQDQLFLNNQEIAEINNTDDFHVFRVAVDVRKGKTSIWRDGKLLGSWEIKASSGDAGDEFLLGDFLSVPQGSSNNETAIDYLRWMPLPPMPERVQKEKYAAPADLTHRYEFDTCDPVTQYGWEWHGLLGSTRYTIDKGNLFFTSPQLTSWGFFEESGPESAWGKADLSGGFTFEIKARVFSAPYYNGFTLDFSAAGVQAKLALGRGKLYLNGQEHKIPVDGVMHTCRIAADPREKKVHLWINGQQALSVDARQSDQHKIIIGDPASDPWENVCAALVDYIRWEPGIHKP